MKYLSVFIFIMFQLPACKKKDLLKEKSNTSILVPTTPVDMQGLLDHEIVFAPTTFLNFVSADEFYFTDSCVQKLGLSEKGAYLWLDFTFGAHEQVADWNNGYLQVYYSNTILKGIDQLSTTVDAKILNPLKGDALFKRAFAFYNLAQVFALPFDSSTAATALGIPLRLTIDRKEVIERSTVAETYNQILNDLDSAVSLLPAAVDFAHRNRSSRPAALALLSRVYLSMGAFGQALQTGSASLSLYDSLIDYNTGVSPSYFPFTSKNGETLYQSKMADDNGKLLDALVTRGAFIDSNLVRKYEVGDLRPFVFFTRSVPPTTIKGSYFGKIAPFSGLGTPELHLTVAECYIRLQQVPAGLLYLNKLLKSRWKAGQYIPYTTVSPEEALYKILLERRKELVFRGVRWTDLRRLNKKNPALTLSRMVQGIKYELLPNSLRYALPIPEEAIRFNGIEQNQR